MKSKRLNNIRDIINNATQIINNATFLFLNNKNCDFLYIDKIKFKIIIKSRSKLCKLLEIFLYKAEV
mgnify:CR=1 FL=1